MLTRKFSIPSIVSHTLIGMLFVCWNSVGYTQSMSTATHRPQQRTVIEFWTMSLKPKFIPYFESLVSRYQKANPTIDVKWVDLPWDIMQLKLITAIASGKPPSLVNLSVPWAEEMARADLLTPVDAYLKVGDGPVPYTQAALDDLRFNGKIYGFPHYSNVNVIACNRELLALAGVLDAPKNLDQLLEQAKTIARITGKAAYAPALGKIDGFFLQQGLPIIENGKAVFNSSAHVALVEKLKLTYQANAFLKDSLFAEDNFPAVIRAYLGGRLAMMVSGPTAIKRIQLESPDVYAKTEVKAMPPGPTGLNDGGWMFHFAIPKNVPKQNLPEVTRFARFLTNAENQLEFARLAGVMPTAPAALNHPAFLPPSSVDASQQALRIAANSMSAARSLYVAGIDDYDELRRVLVQAIEASLTGRQTIQVALDQAVRHWNLKLEKKVSEYPIRAETQLLQRAAATNGGVQ